MTQAAYSGFCLIAEPCEGGFKQSMAEHPFRTAVRGVGEPQRKPITAAEIGFEFTRGWVARGDKVYRARDGYLSTDEASGELVGTSITNTPDGQMVTFRRWQADPKA